MSSSSSAPPIRVGICAMDKKVRSAPMQNILARLCSKGCIEVVYFGDDLLLSAPWESWPRCDVLIAFYSTGFPLEKAQFYVKARKPRCINDLDMQQVLMDRRLVLLLLDVCGVPTPPGRLIASRDGGPRLDPDLSLLLFQKYALTVTPDPQPEVKLLKDAIEINSRRLNMPLVEKPVDGEDHNVRIYFDSSRNGGGVRQLFRKVKDQCSLFLPGPVQEIRLEGSFVYEAFLDVDRAEDVKVYTVGPNYVYAEARRSPVTQDKVSRNEQGYEIRRVTELSAYELDLAHRIHAAFGQTICGFDLLRCNGQSYVMDVNGWSFVKGNEDYYEQCAQVLYECCTLK